MNRSLNRFLDPILETIQWECNWSLWLESILAGSPRTGTRWCCSAGGRRTTWRGCAPSAATTSSRPSNYDRSCRTCRMSLPILQDRLTSLAPSDWPPHSTSGPAYPRRSSSCRVPVADHRPRSRYPSGSFFFFSCCLAPRGVNGVLLQQGGYRSLSQMLVEQDVTLHVIADQQFQFSKVRASRQFLG